MSKWLIVLLAVLLLVVIALIVYACVDFKGSTAVNVASVAGEADPLGSFNVLFLGDGFQGVEELDTYRAAVQYLATDLMASDPFCHYADRINFYRIDVEDPTGKVAQGNCVSTPPVLQPTEPMKLPADVDPASEDLGVVEEDLGATQCYTSASGGSGPTNVIWLDKEGQKTAYLLAEAAPSIALVIVVVNAAHDYGAGYQDVWPGSIGLAVVGVPQEWDTPDQKWVITKHGHLLFAHEFGHGLGLLDEYNYGSVAHPPIPPSRNVWEPEADWPDQPGSSSTRPIPWPDAMLRPVTGVACTPAAMISCCGYLDVDRNHKLCPSPKPDCAYVSAECQNPVEYCSFNPCDLPADCPSTIEPGVDLKSHPSCDDFPGAWEGASYKETGYYRSRMTCRMKEIFEEAGFCDACVIYLRNYFGHYGDGPFSMGYATMMAACPTALAQDPLDNSLGPEFPDPN